MRKKIITVAIFFYSSWALAAKTYQIDMILFAQPQAANYPSLLTAKTPLTPNAIALQNQSKSLTTPYHLLPTKLSSLNDVYYQLHRKPQYQLLAHYVWRQPIKNQSTVALPTINTQGWEVKGTVRVHQGAYYEWNSTLQCSPPSHPQNTFKVIQNHRLKDNLTYYFDDPRLGMLIKIHPVA